MCPAKECQKLLEPKTGIDKKTGEYVIYYNCPNCHYDFVSQKNHVNGQYQAEGKLELK